MRVGWKDKQDNSVMRIVWFYRLWNSIWSRCNSKRDMNYGGRGIRVCKEWLDCEVFIAWCQKENPPWRWSLERRDVNGNYCPENCCFIPLEQQAWNRRTTHWIEYGGEKYCLEEFARKFGKVPLTTVCSRINKGWNPLEAATTPLLQNWSNEPWSEEKKETFYKKAYTEDNPHIKWVEYEGNTYMQKEFIAKFAVVDRSRVAERMKQGWNVIDATLTPDKRFKKITYQGGEYPLEEFIKKFATVSKVAVYRRIKQGWEVEKAVLTPAASTCVKGGLKKTGK